MPWPNTLGSPTARAATSSVCMGLKSPDAPAYSTRSARVSRWVTTGASSPSCTSSNGSTVVPLSRIPGKAEQALGDHVALDVAGPAGDAQGAVPEEAGDPA